MFAKPMAMRCYGLAAKSDAESGATRIARQLVNGPERVMVNAREIQRHGWSGLTSAAEVHAALRVLGEANWLFGVEPASSPKGGRSRKDFEINPLVWYRARAIRR